MAKPKYRQDQLVMLLDHNTQRPMLKSTDPNYRIDAGVVKIKKICPFTAFNGTIQYEYEVAPGYGRNLSALVHEAWLRELTGQEITGRI